MFEDRVHSVVPVVLMVPGVHAGSGGPALYLPEEYSKHVQAWNGEPVPIYHPTEDGTPISANDPEVLREQNVGRIFNVHMDGDKLKGEAWIDVDKAQRVYPALLQMIAGGQDIDVSTAFFSDDEHAPGVWNDENYEFIVRNVRPDHLALLPHSQGACSFEDGCGIRHNTKEGGDDGPMKVITAEEAKAVGKQLAEADLTTPEKRNWLMEKLTSLVNYFRSNDLSDDEVRSKLQREVDKLDTPPEPAPAVYHYVVDVYEDYFVFEARTVADGIPTEAKLFRQDFEITEEDGIKLKGKPKEVRQETSYVAAAAVDPKQAEETTESNILEKEGHGDMDRKAKVDALIANEKSTFVEGDRQFLEGLDDKSFENVEAIATRYHEAHEAQIAALTAKPQEDDDPPPDSDKDEPEPVTVEQYIENAPGDVQEVLREGVNSLNEERKTLTEAILNGTKVYTEDELKAKNLTELRQIAQLAKVETPVDYSGRGVGITNTTDLSERQADGSGVPPAPTVNELLPKPKQE